MRSRGSTVLLYATRNDLIPGLTSLEDALPVKYVRSGVFPNKEPIVCETFSGIEDLGTCPTADAVRCAAYLIMPKAADISARSFRLRTGETRYAIDHAENPYQQSSAQAAESRVRR